MDPKLLLDAALKVLAALTLLFGAIFYAMKVIYKLVGTKNGKKDPPALGPGEAKICRDRGEMLAEFKVVLSRVDRAVGELYRDRFGVEPR